MANAIRLMANAIRLMANAISVTRSHSGKTVCQTDMANAIRLMANAISVKRSYSEKKTQTANAEGIMANVIWLLCA